MCLRKMKISIKLFQIVIATAGIFITTVKSEATESVTTSETSVTILNTSESATTSKMPASTIPGAATTSMPASTISWTNEASYQSTTSTSRTSETTSESPLTTSGLTTKTNESSATSSLKSTTDEATATTLESTELPRELTSTTSGTTTVTDEATATTLESTEPPGELTSTTSGTTIVTDEATATTLESNELPGELTSTTSGTTAVTDEATVSTLESTEPPGELTSTTSGTSTITDEVTATTLESTEPPGELSSTTSGTTTSTDEATVTTQESSEQTDGSLSTTSGTTFMSEETTTRATTYYSSETTLNSSYSISPITTTSKQQDTTTTRYRDVIKPINSLKINIDFDIKLTNATFNMSFANKSSDTYKIYEHSLRIELNKLYRYIIGFDYVIINGFRNGSIVCNYTVVVNADSALDTVGQCIVEKTSNLSKSSLRIGDDILNISVDDIAVNKSVQKVLDKQKENICGVVDRPCEIFEDCISTDSKTITCRHKCSKEINLCYNGGSCFYDDEAKTTQCKCKRDDDYIYYGPTCIQKTEKLVLLKNEIIGISAGCGGGVVVILLVVIIILLKKKPRNEKYSDQKPAISREVSIEDIRLNKLSDSRSSNGFQNPLGTRAEPNLYGSRLPETKFLQGRAHDIYKDRNTGEETYIYPSPSYIHPISTPERRDSSRSGQTMYDYIDTESKFEIQRPRIRLTQNYDF